MKKIFNIANLYMILAIFLNLQDVIYEGGLLISKLIIGVFALFSLILWVITNIKFNLPIFFHGLNLLLLIFTIYGIAHLFNNNLDYVSASDADVANYTYLLIIYISVLPIYAFYFFTKKGALDIPTLQFWGVILLLVYVARFTSYYFVKTSDMITDGITNNYGYLFAGLLPLLVYYSNKTFLQYILLIICAIFVVFSMKRGAILVFMICLIPFTLHILKQSSRRKRFFIYLCISLLIVGGILGIQYFLASNDYFARRIDDTLSGYTSRRDLISEDILNYYINKAPILQQIFGGGANFTLKITENYAHNDWLEILVNQGLFGILIYTIYWFCYYRTYNISKKLTQAVNDTHRYSTTILITLIYSFILTFYSMSYSNLPIAFSIALGFSLGKLSEVQSSIQKHA